MPEHIIAYSTKPATAKIVLILASVSVLLVVWFGVRFQLGDLMSEVTSLNDPQAPEIATTAVSFSPTNPRAFWLEGAVHRKNFDQPSIDAAIASFTEAARLGPFHFRWWTELGRAHEQSGNSEAAEKAFLRAVELAPEYTSPRWQLGNFYLRQGNIASATPQLSVATKHSSLYRGQVYAIAWNIFGKNVEAVEQFANDTPESRASLALFYASQNRPDDALRNWNTLTNVEKAKFRNEAETAARVLIGLRSYSGALEFSREAGIDPEARRELITNGDFESAIKERDQLFFDWVATRRTPNLEIALDGRVKSGGNRSLRLSFRSFVEPWLDSVSQTIVVVPGRRYRVSFSYRTEELRGIGLPRVEVLNLHDSTYMATSLLVPTGANEWQQSSFEFTAAGSADGVAIKIGREPCGGECPLIGTVWIDDIALSRV